MNTPSPKVPALTGILQAAAHILSTHAENLREDVQVIDGGCAGTTPEQVADFAVGSLLPLEKAAQDLLALVAAARAVQGIK